VRTLDFNRHALSICAATVLLASCGGQTGNTVPTVNGAGKSLPYHKTFSYTGGQQWFTVPTGVTKLRVVAVGARGAGAKRALGGRVWAIIPATPGEKLAVFVGGAGSGSVGGFDGGANGGTASCPNTCGFGGGGASDIREGGDTLADRILVVGGGGGAGEDGTGGNYGSFGSYKGGVGGIGGGSTGVSGGSGSSSSFEDGGGGGSGGTQSNGGAGGSGGLGGTGVGNPGYAGALGEGGAGGEGCTVTYCIPGANGGGGGGGYYGGGGGGAGGSIVSESGAGGGGGGGSSYIEPSAYAYRSWQGWKIKTSNGLVVFDW
jgi:hypothetical protein